MSALTIDEEFRDLLPPVSRVTDEALEKLILDEGRVRNPIHVWKGIVIDGQRRYQIAQKHGIPFETIEIDLPDREAVKQWMIDDFISRRSATSGQLRSHLVALEKKHAAGPRSRRDNETGRAAAKAAEEAGVTERTVYRAKAAEKQLRTLSEDVRRKVELNNVRFSDGTIQRLAALNEEQQHEVIDYYVDHKYDALGKVLDALYPLPMGKSEANPGKEPDRVLSDTPSAYTVPPPKPYLDYLDAATKLLGKVIDQLTLAQRADDTEGSKGRFMACREQINVVSARIDRWKHPEKF